MHITITKASLHPVRTPNGGIVWVPEEVTEKEVTVDAADMSTNSGKRKVFARNMAAIRTVKRLEDEEREATPEELKVLKSFSGFGGLIEAFDQYNTASNLPSCLILMPTGE